MIDMRSVGYIARFCRAQMMVCLAALGSAPKLSQAADQPPPLSSLDDKCTKGFPFILPAVPGVATGPGSPPAQVANYSMVGMRLLVIDPPPGTSVRFLLSTRANDANTRPGAVTTSGASAQFVALGADRALWLNGTPTSVSDILEGQLNDFSLPIKTMPTDNIVIGVTPALFVGPNKRRSPKQKWSPAQPTFSLRGEETSAFCLQQQPAFTWSDASNPSHDEWINEAWFGTTAVSPIYAVVQVKWTTRKK
jgi:hypothetical protein